ncbi:XRE family transcriptional regulator [Intestinimonas butyriciproducens]|uniref:XRE family transcriptional regulator n=1 Tax=Intestinimonas butyriciproducens TaxID=1297617 RepID=UPI00195B6D3D|nr:XRE family transcriptional regulator [Intestinimonas butyriciproducens]MBM6976594.1 helix-turn-helix transcriptional regulator [Intestinimonas butyriciproducens]
MSNQKKSGGAAPGKVVSFRPNASDWNAAEDRANNIVGQRIAAERKRCGLTLEAMCERLRDHGVEIQIQGLNKWEKGLTVPNAYQFLAVCRVLGIEDCMVGIESSRLDDVGLRKLDEYKMDLIASGRYRPSPSQYRETYIEMPVSTLAVSAGTGEFLDEGGFEMVRFPKSAVPSGADFGVRVHGDSMEPVYHDGQIVWVEKTDTLHPGEVGIFSCNGEGYLKVYDLQKPCEGDAEDYTDSYGVLHPQAVLVSYNEKYAPKTILPSDTFKIVGRVLSK